MRPFKRIVVAVDGSENSLEACSAAGRLAGRQGTSVDVIEVVPEGDARRVRAEAKGTLTKGCELASSGTTRPAGKLIEGHGSIVGAIIGFASKRRSDLIVVGAKGSGGFKELLLGSVAGGVVTHALVPVLVVRRLPSLKGRLFGHVLAAVDGSEASKEAVSIAAALANSAGAKLTTLHVICIPSAAYMSGTSGTASAEETARREAEGYLAQARETAEACGTVPKPRIVEDLQSPVRGITEFASRNAVELIVMGTRGLGGFKKLLLGSVASGVISYAPCSVMVVRNRWPK